VGDDFVVIKKNSIEIGDLFLEYQEFIRDKQTPWGRINPFVALQKISLDITEGENVALLGRNGAGKSTLLRCIAGLIRPSGGKIITRGRVILLAGVDPGFIADLSGRQNVIELGRAYGIPPEQIEVFSDSIEEFALLGDAFDRRFGSYSTGMRGKLGFGFITALNPDILLIDETLGVGDREFRKRAQERLRDFISKSGTVVISTHSLGLAKELCGRGILLEKGQLDMDGGIEDVIRRYSDITD
jgi:ABC-type polysaccharide/polyol phosphate transport system ATPase subunit